MKKIAKNEVFERQKTMHFWGSKSEHFEGSETGGFKWRSPSPKGISSGGDFGAHFESSFFDFGVSKIADMRHK